MHEGLPKARSEKDDSQGTGFSRLAIFDMPPIADLDLKLVSGKQEKIPSVSHQTPPRGDAAMTFKRVMIFAFLVLLGIPWTSAEAGWWIRNRRYRAYYVAPAPVYVQPYPVYVQPVPVYGQPTRIYIRPALVPARLTPVPVPATSQSIPLQPEPIRAPIP
jgi:hypothetical protein